MKLTQDILCAVPDLRNAPCVFYVTNLIVCKSVNTVITPVYGLLSARPFVPNTSSRNVLLFQKLPLFVIAVQKAEPVTRTKHSTSHRMQISPHRNFSYHAGRALIKVQLISLCLMTLFHHYLPRGSLSLIFMPFTGMRFLVPERRSTII